MWTYLKNCRRPNRYHVQLYPPIDPFILRVNYGDMQCCSNVSVWTKSYGVAIQMKPLQQYFWILIFLLLLLFFRNSSFGFFLNFDFLFSWKLQLYREHPTNAGFLKLANHRALNQFKLILSLRVYHRSVKLGTNYGDFIYFFASHNVSAVTKRIIRISWWYRGNLKTFVGCSR